MDKCNHIFNRKFLGNKLENFDISSIKDLDKKHKIISNWIYSIENSDLNKTKEKSVQGDFLTAFFTNILGYKKRYGNDIWNITQEQKTLLDGTTSDGSLGFFTSSITDIRVVIELKDANTDLDKKQKSRENKISPVEQAFSYAPKSGKRCNWIIVSNFIEIRLYHQSSELEYEKFLITDLIKGDEFKRFYYLLCYENLINRDTISLIDDLYNKNEEEQKYISKNFYKDYKNTRLSLFEGLKKNNPEVDELLLFEKSQKFMDRFIFVCFCEDKQLLPENTFRNVIKIATMSFDISDNKIWTQLKGLFHAINKGNPPMNINRFNGGLFAPDKELDNLYVPDDMFIGLEKLADYDFDTDLNVNILGHIFEQSISDIEEIKSEIRGEFIEKRDGKRKKDGIFYTPEYITYYIVEQTIGKWLEDKKKEFGEDKLPNIPELKANMTVVEKRSRNKTINTHISFWQRYADILSNIKVVDIACGSGAFLNQSFDYLYKEGQRVNSILTDLRGGQITLFDLDKHILKNNLYGVDLNKESVEITKLSLWLKTANKKDPLTSLDENIKCGNSVIDSNEYTNERAFKWDDEFKEIFATGGFDVIVGNPPYVRQELLGKSKEYFKNNYKVYNAASDLFAYFYEKSANLLKPKGIMGFISNTFSKTSAGLELRHYLKNNTKFVSYTDFSDLQIFEGATTYPIIIVIDKKIPMNNRFKYFKVDGHFLNNLSNGLNENGILINQSSLDDNNWTFKSESINIIKEKLFAYPKLKDISGKTYRGILTGLNKAFIITNEQKDAFIKDNPKSSELLKPFLEGRDLRKWNIKSVGKWLLLFPKGWTKQLLSNEINEEDGWNYIKTNFPKISGHLINFKDEGKKRCDKGEFWWELRACGYYDLFEKNKIVWPNLQSANKFAIDENGFYINAPAVSLPTEKKSILCILNSNLAWFLLKDICVIRNGGFIEVKPQYIEQLPISLSKDEEPFNIRTEKIIKLNASSDEKISQFNSYIQTIYKPKKITDKIEQFYLLDFEGYILELKKQKVTLNDTSKFELMNLFNKVKLEIISTKDKISNLEYEINQLVYEAYNLTKEEIQVIEQSLKQ